MRFHQMWWGLKDGDWQDHVEDHVDVDKGELREILRDSLEAVKTLVECTLAPIIDVMTHLPFDAYFSEWMRRDDDSED